MYGTEKAAASEVACECKRATGGEDADVEFQKKDQNNSIFTCQHIFGNKAEFIHSFIHSLNRDSQVLLTGNASLVFNSVLTTAHNKGPIMLSTLSSALCNLLHTSDIFSQGMCVYHALCNGSLLSDEAPSLFDCVIILLSMDESEISRRQCLVTLRTIS